MSTKRVLDQTSLELDERRRQRDSRAKRGRLCIHDSTALKSGTCINDKVVLPIIDLIPTNTNLSFDFKIRQFPIKLAFAITINKAQGQSLEIVASVMISSM